MWVKLKRVQHLAKPTQNIMEKKFRFFKPTDLQQGTSTITASDNLSKLGFEKTRKLPKDLILVTCH